MISTCFHLFLNRAAHTGAHPATFTLQWHTCSAHHVLHQPRGSLHPILKFSRTFVVDGAQPGGPSYRYLLFIVLPDVIYQMAVITTTRSHGAPFGWQELGRKDMAPLPI